MRAMTTLKNCHPPCERQYHQWIHFYIKIAYSHIFPISDVAESDIDHPYVKGCFKPESHTGNTEAPTVEYTLHKASEAFYGHFKADSQQPEVIQSTLSVTNIPLTVSILYINIF